MSIIRRSDDLEVIVLRIFEDFYRFGGDFYIISPWIHNFSFTEAITTGLQIQIFGSEPSLHKILQRCSENHGPLKIVSHNFGMKPTFSLSDLNAKLVRFGIDAQNPESTMKNEKMERLFELYLTLFKEYKEYSKFNSPWISIACRSFEGFLDHLSTKQNYSNTVYELVDCSKKVSYNIEYLNDLRKFLKVKNVKIGLHNNFHAKIFLAGSLCVTGSSNWTFSGFVKNDEINLFFSKIDSPKELEKIRERCHEIERQARFVNLENVVFTISLHKILQTLYLKFFDWSTDNKKELIKSTQ